MQNHIPTMLNSPLYFPRAGFLAARLYVPWFSSHTRRHTLNPDLGWLRCPIFRISKKYSVSISGYHSSSDSSEAVRLLLACRHVYPSPAICWAKWKINSRLTYICCCWCSTWATHLFQCIIYNSVSYCITRILNVESALDIIPELQPKQKITKRIYPYGNMGLQYWSPLREWALPGIFIW